MADFDCCTFVEVALEIATSKLAEEQAYLRTAAGRAYYAVHGLIRRNLQQRHNHKFGTSGSHKDFITACTADKRRENLNELGQWLKELQGYRVKADYHWEATANLTITEIEDAIDAANEAIAIIHGLPAGDWQALHKMVPEK